MTSGGSGRIVVMICWGRPAGWATFPEGGDELQQLLPVLGLSGARATIQVAS